MREPLLTKPAGGTLVLPSAQIVAFIATSDPQASLHFYRNVLGLTLIEDSPYALVFNANGTMLRIQKVEDFDPAPFTALGWKVADIRATIATLNARGVTCERYSFMEQDDAGIWTTPDGSQVAWFADPDGNTLSLTQFAQALAAPVDPQVVVQAPDRR